MFRVGEFCFKVQIDNSTISLRHKRLSVISILNLYHLAAHFPRINRKMYSFFDTMELNTDLGTSGTVYGP